MTTDRLTLAHAFEQAGIERSQAENVAGVVLDAIRDNVATKADLSVLDARMTFMQWQIGVVAALLLLLLGSQAAIWIKLGEMSGQLAAIAHVLK